MLVTRGMPRCPVCGLQSKLGVVGPGTPEDGTRDRLLSITYPAHIAILEREILAKGAHAGNLGELRKLLRVGWPGGPRPDDFRTAVASLLQKRESNDFPENLKRRVARITREAQPC